MNQNALIMFWFSQYLHHNVCSLASDGDEQQGWAHASRATVEGLLTVSQSSDDHANSLRTAQMSLFLECEAAGTFFHHFHVSKEKESGALSITVNQQCQAMWMCAGSPGWRGCIPAVCLSEPTSQSPADMACLRGAPSARRWCRRSAQWWSQTWRLPQHQQRSYSGPRCFRYTRGKIRIYPEWHSAKQTISRGVFW